MVLRVGFRLGDASSNFFSQAFNIFPVYYCADVSEIEAVSSVNRYRIQLSARKSYKILLRNHLNHQGP